MRHQSIFEIIAWMSPELHDLAKALDRFASLRKAGLKPWLSKLGRHWPAAAVASSPGISGLETVDDAFDASNGADTPFGHRWGGDVVTLTGGQIEVMRSGQTLALDVMNEYVVFLKTEPEEGK